MNKYSRFLVLLLAFLLALPMSAGAEETAPAETAAETTGGLGETYYDQMQSDLSYFDDIYRFDLQMGQEEAGTEAEVLSHEKAVFAVLALGIMERMPDGTFSENLTVSYPDFAGMLYRLSTGKDDGGVANYELYEERPTTVEEAAYHIVGALGYVTEENQESFPSMSRAAQLGLLKGQSLSAEQYITRGQLAQMFYHALEVDLAVQTVYGTTNQYEVIKGETLLGERFNAVKLDGVLTAAGGVNLYSTVAPKPNRIEIDRVPYMTGEEDYTDLLGRRVFGYVQQADDGSDPMVLGLMQSDRDESVLVPLHEILSVTSRELVYQTEDGEEDVSLSGIQHVLYNGTLQENYVFSGSLTDHEGDLLLGQSESGGDYDLAVICAKSSYRVRYISTTDEKLFLADGLQFKGVDFVSVAADNKHFVRLVKNGMTITLSDIKVNDVISVVQSDDGAYTHIDVSDKKVMGTVTGVADGKITIAGKEYMVSGLYREASLNPDSPARDFIPGDTGTFYLSADGTVAGFSGDDGISFGYMTQMRSSSGLDSDMAVKLFSEAGEWLELEVADRVELDGVQMDEADVISQLRSIESQVFYQPVRYKLNAGKEIIFLDTLYQTLAESADPENLTMATTWSGRTDWTSPYVVYSGNTGYSIFDAVMFMVPNDVTNEKGYYVRKSTAVPIDTTVSLDIYNVNDIGYASLLVYKGGSVNASTFYGSRAFAVEKVYQTVDEEGEIRMALSGYETLFTSPGVGAWPKATYIVSRELEEEEPDLTFKPGDIFMYIKDSETLELRDYDLHVRDNQLVSGKASSQIDGEVTYAIGRVSRLKFDSSVKLLEVEVEQTGGGTSQLVFLPRGVQIYDTQKQKYTQTTLEEVGIGDKVFVSGQGCHVAVTVFR